ncbi:hypothetical protein GCM10010269_04910 [Streptomyces humidus]|uniref:Uncharacterized protein n=1 Tax=Streptomyces humidus TaxID=52259 RepID=A0A918FQS5_9ACTN|nr:hypothetical protein [Streptomyces humidus]GGR69173.1 hypothetical protein GCM10010269_04910 [Streptomyces humidus]
MATDEVVEGLCYFTHLLGDDEQERARRDLELLELCSGDHATYVGSAPLHEPTGPGGELPTRDRASCPTFCAARPDDTYASCAPARTPVTPTASPSWQAPRPRPADGLQ